MSDPLGSALRTRKVILILNIENAVLLSFSGIIIWRKIGKERRRRLCHLASFSLTVLPLFFLVCWLSCRVCLICWRLSSYLLQTGLSSSLLSHAKRKENSWWTQKQLFRIFNCVTQLKLYTGDKLSSSIFWCLSVRHRCHPTKSLLFPIYKGIQALCWPCTT